MRKNNLVKKKINTLLQLFPIPPNPSDIAKLKIDKDSYQLISTKNYADDITAIITKYMNQINIKSKEITITDATAGVGGNSISFAHEFKHVHAIEIDNTRSKFLASNLEVYQFTNVNVYNDDCQNIIYSLYHDVIFFDPPWGGKNYKKFTNLKFNLP